MKFVVPREGANAPQTRAFPKLYWFFCLLVLFAALLTDAMANSGPSAMRTEIRSFIQLNPAIHLL